MSLNPLTYQPHSNFQQGATMFTAFSVQLLVCDWSVSVNVITHTSVGLKCLTETKIQIIVEMGCQIVQLLSAYTVGPTMFANLTPALDSVMVASRRGGTCYVGVPGDVPFSWVYFYTKILKQDIYTFCPKILKWGINFEEKF